MSYAYGFDVSFTMPSQQAYATPPKIATPPRSTCQMATAAAKAAQMPTMYRVMPATPCRNPLMQSSLRPGGSDGKA